MTKHAVALLLLTGCMSSSSSNPSEPPGMPSAGASADTGMGNGIFSFTDAGAWEEADGGLVLVPSDAGEGVDSAVDANDAGDAGVDASTADASTTDAGHDAGTPPEPGKTCDPCEADADCAANYRCQLRPKDGVKECFLFDDTSLYDPTDPTAYTGCNKLLPLNHLRQACYAYVPPGENCQGKWTCGPYDAALTCAQWKEYWGPQTTY